MKPKSRQLSRYSAAFAILLIASGVSQAAITVLGVGSAVTNDTHNSSKPNPSGNFGYNSTTKIYTYNFNAGATSDMLVVSLSAEKSAEAFTISYGGSFLTQAVSTDPGSGASIWYLANPAATGTITINASLVATMNGFGIGIASLYGNGDEIALHSVGSSTNSNSVGITTTVAGSFVMVGADSNNGVNTTVPSLNSPLTQIFANGDVGSSKAAAGRQNAVGIGTHTYTYTSNSATEPGRGIAAASFVTIPEPAAAGLIGIAGMLGLLRRRR